MDVVQHNLLGQVNPVYLTWMRNQGLNLPEPQHQLPQTQASQPATSSLPVQPSPTLHPPHHLLPRYPPESSSDPPPLSILPTIGINQQAHPPQVESLEKGDEQLSTSAFPRLEVDNLKARHIQCNSLACFSDRRCKEDVRTLSPQETLAILSRIQAKKFKYKKEFGGDGRDVYGFIAQELREVCPDLVEEVSTPIHTFPLPYANCLLYRLNQASWPFEIGK